MMHHMNARALHWQQFFDLPGREFGHSDNGVRFLGRAACLLRKAAAKLRRRIVAGQYEEIVKRGHRLVKADARDPLVQPMKKIARAGKERLIEQCPPRVGRQRGAERAEVPVRPVAIGEGLLGMGRRQRAQQFTRVHPYTGKIFSPTL